MYTILLLLSSLLLASAVKANVTTASETSSSPGSVQDRIVGGKLARLGHFPYQAYVIIDSKTYCGGSLIKQNTILTAAHCVSGYRHWKVYLGTIVRKDHGPETWTTSSTSAKSHEAYNHSDRKNDVAVIHLEKCAPRNRYIKPVRLPASNEVGDTAPGRSAIASGWGGTDNGANYLEWAKLTIISNKECRKYYKHINKKMVCTKHKQKNVCYGDGGGPLVNKHSSRSQKIIGITSYISPEGCKSTQPAVYTKVAAFLGWIKKNTLNKKC